MKNTKLKEAAKKYIDKTYHPNYLFKKELREIFRKGANYQAEQDKNLAIEFAEWCSESRFWNNTDVQETWYKLKPNSMEVDLTKRYSTKELFQMFLKSKEK